MYVRERHWSLHHLGNTNFLSLEHKRTTTTQANPTRTRTTTTTTPSLPECQRFKVIRRQSGQAEYDMYTDEDASDTDYLSHTPGESTLSHSVTPHLLTCFTLVPAPMWPLASSHDAQPIPVAKNSVAYNCLFHDKHTCHAANQKH